jgi:hypothetical protein
MNVTRPPVVAVPGSDLPQRRDLPASEHLKVNHCQPYKYI